MQGASPSYALLRHGVSPGDPHLIAPALPDHQLIPPYRPDGALPGAPAADLRQHQQQQQQQEAVGQLKTELRGLGDQLVLLRQSASSWQQVAAAVTGVDSRCAANTSQLAARGAGVAEVRASHGRLQESSSTQYQEVQGCLAALGGRLDALAQGASKADAAALQPLDSRLEQGEQALAGLQSRLDQQGAVPAAGIPPAVAAAAAAAVASVQAELAAVQGTQRGTAHVQEAQQAQLGGIQSDLQALQCSHGRVEGQLAAQQAWLSAQLAELRAAQGRASQQQGGQVEQLAVQLAEVSAQVEQHAQQLQQQQQEQHVVPGPEQADQVAAAQTEQLQQLAAVQTAVDDINQRLFELRVEVQNATEDTASEAAATKRQVRRGQQLVHPYFCRAWLLPSCKHVVWPERVQWLLRYLAHQQSPLPSVHPPFALQAEVAERQAAEAVGAVANLRRLAASLEQQVAALQEQTSATAAARGSGTAEEAAAAAAAPNGSNASLAVTSEQVVAELAAMKLLLAQQQEAAEGAAAASRAEAAAREEQVAYMQAALAALDYRLQQHGSQAGQAEGSSGSGSGSGEEAAAHAAETAACLATLTDIVHRQREELQAVKQGVAAAQAATAAAAGAATEGQQQAAHQAELAEVRQQLATMQEAAAGNAALRDDVAALQRKLAVGEESGDGSLGEAHLNPALAAVQLRLAHLEPSAAAQQRQQQAECAGEEGAAGSEAAGAASSGQLEALQARIASMEAALAGDRASAAAALAAQQQAQQVLAALQLQVEGMQQQLGALAATAAAGQQAQHQEEQQREQEQEEQGLGLPPAALQEVEGRMCSTEVTVATALEEVAAQMAALVARVDRAEASSVAAATHAQAAAAVAQQQAAAVQGMLASPLALSRQPSSSSQPSSGQQQVSRQGSLQRSPSQQQAAAHPPAEELPAGSLSRQSSLQRSQSQSQQGESLPQSPRQPAGTAAAQASSGGGLFARLSRSFSSQQRGSSTGSVGQDSDAVAPGASTAAELSHSGEMPLRAQCSTEGSAAPSRERSRRASTSSGGGGGGSGVGTPRGSAAAAAAAHQQHQQQADIHLYTPRSRHSPRNWVAAAAGLQQERSGASSAGASPRQGLPAGGFSSFGELPLPQGSSCLVSPRFVSCGGADGSQQVPQLGFGVPARQLRAPPPACFATSKRHTPPASLLGRRLLCLQGGRGGADPGAGG